MKNTLIGGTLLLTFTGFATRFLGFFYRIFLSGELGAKQLGIYQLLFPVYGICFTIFASGIQTAISKQVAEELTGHPASSRRVLGSGLLLSVSLALMLSLALSLCCSQVASFFLKEPECARSLRLLSFAFPFSGITSCISGYCYGKKKSFLPATSQLVEQIFRVVILFLLARQREVSCELAILALVTGESCSCLYSILLCFFQRSKPSADLTPQPALPIVSALKKTLSISVPLTSNRLFISVLHSFEAFLVPLTLRRYGLSRDESLSIFGILSGMTMSFLMFPGTLTNSLSVLLLPAISEAKIRGSQSILSRSIAAAVKYSVLLGIFSGFFFFFFGEELGMTVFHEKKAGEYLACLSFLCPFLYLSTTLSSILNGLDKMNLTFLSSVLSLSLRSVLFCILIPRCSVYGYFVSLLVSQLFVTFFDLFFVCREVPFAFHAGNTILKPALLLLAGTSFFFRVYQFLVHQTGLPALPLLGLCSLLFSLSMITFFFLTGVCSRHELI